jgi:hypothetical protein
MGSEIVVHTATVLHIFLKVFLFNATSFKDRRNEIMHMGLKLFFNISLISSELQVVKEIIFIKKGYKIQLVYSYTN